jgi:hypothetical protein
MYYFKETIMRMIILLCKYIKNRANNTSNEILLNGSSLYKIKTRLKLIYYMENYSLIQILFLIRIYPLIIIIFEFVVF